MSKLAEWIERESKKESFGVKISAAHENNDIEVSDDDKARRIRTIISAKGTFKRRFIETKIFVADKRAVDMRDLPLSVEIHFADLAKYASIKEPIGMLRFHAAMDSGDGVVNEPDQLTLAMILPDTWMHRLTDRSRPVWLAIEVDGFHTIEQGYMPGQGKKSWQVKDSSHLWVIGCTIRDVVEKDEEQDEEEAPRPTELETLEQIKARLITFTDSMELRVKQWAIGAVVFAVLILAGLSR